MKKQGMKFLNDAQEWVFWLRNEDKADGEYFVYQRAGYPPLVRREFLSPQEIARAFETDDVCKLEQE